jgi:hypothetical protein
MSKTVVEAATNIAKFAGANIAAVIYVLIVFAVLFAINFVVSAIIG